MEAIDRREILRRQRHAERRDLPVHLPAKRPDVLFARSGDIELRRNLLEACGAPLVGRRRQSTTDETPEILGTRVGHLKQRFEQQVEQQVVSPNIDDKRNRRADRSDVREILVGSDADVGATRDAPLF